MNLSRLGQSERASSVIELSKPTGSITPQGKSEATMSPINFLLQTTIEPTANDWHIGHFSMLRNYLASLTTRDGSALLHVTARDRDPVGAPDAVLSALD